MDIRASRLIALLLFASPLFSACERSHEAPAAPPSEVLFVEVKQEDVPLYRDWVGTADGFINAQIRAKVSGFLLKKSYREGSTVKAGELMFEIDPRQFKAALDQAQGELHRAEAALEKSRQDVARYTPLAAEGAVSQKELDDAIQSFAANRAQVDSARAAVEQARLNLDWTKVTAPIEGIAGIAIAQVGDLINEASLLTTISQVDPIKVYFPISEQEYLTVARSVNRAEKAGRPPGEAIPLSLLLADGSTYPHTGRFDIAGREVDVRTGTIQIVALFPNADNILRPGQFARVRAAVETANNAIVVPQRAVQDLQGQYQVAVVKPDDTIEIRNVKVGDKFGSNWIVQSGLQAGDRVVAEGLQKVRAGVKVSAKPWVPDTPVPAAAGGSTSDPGEAPGA
jgi:membrane fusion protein (multidrug efflux system)